VSDLFQPGDAPDDAYRNLRDDERCVESRKFCESLWVRFSPYADRHFLSQIKIQFHPRFWEMYLAVAFLDRGFKLHKHTDGGPEFWIEIEGRRYWFDAIAPTSGTGPDAVPEPDYGGREARLVPQEKIILRYTGALSTKREKWRQDLERGRVSESDGFIVAINDRSVPNAWLGSDMHYVVKGLYGFGNLAWVIDRSTGKIVETKHLYRPTIEKACGQPVSSEPFRARECPEISAALYSCVDAANYPGTLGADFMVLHNCEPNVPLPLGALRFYRECWGEGGELKTKIWSETPSYYPQ
jgi:hypothetical protein